MILMENLCLYLNLIQAYRSNDFNYANSQVFTEVEEMKSYNTRGLK